MCAGSKVLGNLVYYFLLENRGTELREVAMVDYLMVLASDLFWLGADASGSHPPSTSVACAHLPRPGFQDWPLPSLRRRAGHVSPRFYLSYSTPALEAPNITKHRLLLISHLDHTSNPHLSQLAHPLRIMFPRIRNNGRFESPREYQDTHPRGARISDLLFDDDDNHDAAPHPKRTKLRYGAAPFFAHHKTAQVPEFGNTNHNRFAPRAQPVEQAAESQLAVRVEGSSQPSMHCSEAVLLIPVFGRELWKSPQCPPSRCDYSAGRG